MILNKKKKLMLASVILFVAAEGVAYSISPIWMLLPAALAFVGLLALVALLALNKFVKRTWWYRNIFAHTTQFVSNAGYREELTRNYEIVNVGSNPALYAFFYENVAGQNWSTGTQGLDMDLEILKYFHSYVKKGGYVLLPIVPFSSVSGYLKSENAAMEYVVKFVKILDGLQTRNMPKANDARMFIRFPLFLRPQSILRLFRDAQPDTGYTESEQTMQYIDIMRDAKKWMDKVWKPEFAIKDFTAPLTPALVEGRKLSVAMFRNLLDFCLERELKPIIVSPPLSKALCELFTPDIKEIYVDSFVREFKDYGVPFFDYTYDERFTDNSLFRNALFMNLRGRKLFTREVLHRLQLG